MSDEVWMRHANPLSVWTRKAAFPVLVGAIWSRVWIGWSVIPVGLVIAWLIWNPRAFPRPSSTDNWASKAVLGERVWTGTACRNLPLRHRVVPNVANGFAAIGTLALAGGLWMLDPIATVLGAILVASAKLWFVDRMVWLFDDVKHDPQYRGWLY